MRISSGVLRKGCFFGVAAAVAFVLLGCGDQEKTPTAANGGGAQTNSAQSNSAQNNSAQDGAGNNTGAAHSNTGQSSSGENASGTQSNAAGNANTAGSAGGENASQAGNATQGSGAATDDVFAKGAKAWETGRCANCHGKDGTGGVRGPSLADGDWLHCDGSVSGIREVLTTGVPKEKIKDAKHPFAMNPVTNLVSDPKDLDALAEYVFRLSHPSAPAGKE